MKVRTGFVSNSSSSSFICLISEEAYKKVLERLNSKDRYMVEKVAKTTKWCDIPARSVHWYSEDDDDDCAFNFFMTKAKENGAFVFQDSY